MRGLILLLTTSLTVYSNGAVINGYARVTNVSGTTLTISNVDETGDTFEAGDWLLIYQTQDDVIGGNTGDNVSFGDLGAIRSAGLYEVREILSITEASGIPTSITLAESLNNTYYTGSNSHLQVVTYPRFGSPNYTTTTDMDALPWNGNVGGIVCFEVLGELTLAHNINADNAGFRGGSANNDGSSAGCSGASNYRVVSQNNFADKGESIYRLTSANYAAGMGKILNGGGGGNSHNAGGGGGGNYSAGGQGGEGWPNCSPDPGGIGGLDLSGQVSVNRVFLGGGGGSGEGNNGVQIGGGAGGGLALIKAQGIRTSGTCGGIRISANGESVANNNVNDGNGGGGAGGSIVFWVDTWNVVASCPLFIDASGGDGGDVGHTLYHGGGGGGGIGTIIFTTPAPTVNVTTTNAPGIGGINCTACPRADVGEGADGDGILINNIGGPLPVELITFSAFYLDARNEVELKWSTASEHDNDRFVVHRRTAESDKEEIISVVQGAGNSSTTLNYITTDHFPVEGLSYYWLEQIDIDGTSTMSSQRAVMVEPSLNNNLMVSPNPAKDQISIRSYNPIGGKLMIYDALGHAIKGADIPSDGTLRFFEMNVSDLPRGVYHLLIGNRSARFVKH